MLLIRAIQVANLDGVCAYEVAVFINTKPIWKGVVNNHQRSDGWAVLAGHIAHDAGLQCEELKRSIEKSLEIVADQVVRCPACNRVLGYAK